MLSVLYRWDLAPAKGWEREDRFLHSLHFIKAIAKEVMNMLMRLVHSSIKPEMT